MVIVIAASSFQKSNAFGMMNLFQRSFCIPSIELHMKKQFIELQTMSRSLYACTHIQCREVWKCSFKSYNICIHEADCQWVNTCIYGWRWFLMSINIHICLLIKKYLWNCCQLCIFTKLLFTMIFFVGTGLWSRFNGNRAPI